MKIQPLGDRAVLLTELDVAPWRLAQALNGAPPEGLEEAVAAYDAVALHIDPERFEIGTIEAVSIPAERQPRRHPIPVCYEMGEDLGEAAERLSLTVEEVIAMHSGTTYRCAAVGFRPGFAYLGSLPDGLAGLPRMPSPRLRVEAGSVGITGRQTGVYPQAGPGGWWILGRTPLCMVDVAAGYYPIEAGDEVGFFPISESEFSAWENVRP